MRRHLAAAGHHYSGRLIAANALVGCHWGRVSRSATAVTMLKYMESIFTAVSKSTGHLNVREIPAVAEEVAGFLEMALRRGEPLLVRLFHDGFLFQVMLGEQSNGTQRHRALRPQFPTPLQLPEAEQGQALRLRGIRRRSMFAGGDQPLPVAPNIFEISEVGVVPGRLFSPATGAEAGFDVILVLIRAQLRHGGAQVNVGGASIP